MKVRDLVEKLQEFDGNMNVICITEDVDLLPRGDLFRLLDVTDIGITDGEMTRGDDRTPSLKLGKSDLSQKLLVIGVTSDF